ncbi:MAG: hypothetical protein RSB17_05970 [Cetobacterium sp.]
MLNIEIKNCNNIDLGHITIKKNTLNIKHGINGTGKSTISKAIEYHIYNKEALKTLKPFKLISEDNKISEVNGLDNIRSVKIFNDIYIEKIVYSRDELITNSFDIFIKDDMYIENMLKIEELLLEIKSTFIDFPEIENFIADLNKICNSIQFSANGKIKKTSSFSKAFSDGNKLKYIPEELKEYTPFLTSPQNISWLRWQSSGQDYLTIGDNCPYCTSKIKEEEKKKIVKVKETYETKELEHLTNLLKLFKSLELYFSESTNQTIKMITENVTTIKPSEENVLSEIVDQANLLKLELENIKNIDFAKLKELPSIIDGLKKLEINIDLYMHFKSDKTIEEINKINDKIKLLEDKANHLQGKVNIQKKKILSTIDLYKKEINFFLTSAGYKYQVNFVENTNGEHKIKLFPIESESNIENVKEHLSYGERNAFAIVLFMYEVLKENPDLIILDDPISSFDRNKKYAIIDALFRGTKSLKGKTVVMFTHDFEPVLDIAYNLKRNFTPTPTVNFIQNKSNILNEISIEKPDILSCQKVALENIKNLPENINKLIYLRRYKEIEDDKSNTYALLSSLFHKRPTPNKQNNDGTYEMTAEEIQSGVDEIRKFISDFDYSNEYTKIIDDKYLVMLYETASNNYEKLQIYRILTENKSNESENRILRKFINETFHIENDYLFQLNPCKYELIPEYIINECNEEIQTLKKEF